MSQPSLEPQASLPTPPGDGSPVLPAQDGWLHRTPAWALPIAFVGFGMVVLLIAGTGPAGVVVAAALMLAVVVLIATG